MSGPGERVRRFLNRPGTTDLSRYRRLLPEIGAREDDVRELPSAALRGLLTGSPEDAYAALREAARRALGQRPYDVQLLGALVLRSGRVAEMATGEGKTLVGALAAAGYAAGGRSVHALSVNDYLARRDADWMRPFYQLLGVTVSYIGQASSRAERLAAYRADVTYVPVSELGFDVLRDRLRTEADGRVVPDPDVALIDEADCVLIDEARVPMVLAGSADAGESGRDMAAIAHGLRPGRHYEVDLDGRNVSLTEAGARAAEQALGGIDLYSAG
ncbi:MAG: accessory Sec system translocase SecA2, partial [Actinobacteria bacterium]|nr:accessory Sec system translocase SecA2 [Actinomycetota bacterium]